VSNTFSNAVANTLGTGVDTGISGASENETSFSGDSGSNLTIAADDTTGVDVQNSTSEDLTVSVGNTTQTETIHNTDYGYRVPNIESNAQLLRAQISLMDQQFAQYMYGQNLPNLEQVFANELQSIDLDVKRLQVAYLDTLLMSPISGVVTAVFKNLGERVRAGEPVVRVEDNSTVILVATLIFRGLLSVGMTVTVQSPLFDASAPQATINGSIVAVRGYRGEDYKWEVLINCPKTDGSSNPILPLNYNFDYATTTVTIN
jgi:hypothetical protein